MTQDEIIDMAIEAEFVSHGKPSDEESELFVCVDKDIYKFAKLVAAKAIAELESQEPVAWLVEFENKEQELHFDKQSVGETQNPLYTHPPQRAWVGLTDEELAEFSGMKLGSYDLCLEVEAKLKEKNT